MKAMANLVDRTPGLEWLKLSETMSQFSATIASQTDLAVEGKHLYLFNHYFKLWKGVSFPKPIILTDSILVESFEYGDTVDKYVKTISCNKKSMNNIKEEFRSDMIIRKKKLQDLYKQCNLAHFIVTTGEDTYLKMLLQDNLMHADLHPGNILIQQFSKISDNKVSSVGMSKESKRLADAANILSVGDKDQLQSSEISSKIVLVDAGMVARLVPEEQKNFVGLLEAMGEGRGDEAADCVMRFSNKPNYDKKTKLAFRSDMKTLFLTACKGYGHNVDIGFALRGILNLVRIHQITIDANYATLVMNALCLDGMASSLLPTYNILDGAKPLLRFNRIVKRIPGRNFHQILFYILHPSLLFFVDFDY
jgi:aarF domain-containing kinase